MSKTLIPFAIVGAVLSLAACGGNDTSEAQTRAALTGPPRAPCNRTNAACVDLYVIAHPDDDLLFMNPDIQNSINQGNDIVVVVQNGGGGHDASVDLSSNEKSQYWLARERGHLNAYVYMALGDSAAFGSYSPSQSHDVVPSAAVRISDPTTTYFTFNGIRTSRFQITRPQGNKVHVIYLRLADGDVGGIWDGDSGETRACPDIATDKCAGDARTATTLNGAGYYEGQEVSRETLVGAYTQIMSTFGVTSVSTLDSSNINIDGMGGPDVYSDYPDHVFSARFALTAAIRYQAETPSRTVAIRTYRGYSVGLEPQNLAYSPTDTERTIKQRAFLYYAMFDTGTMWPTVGGEPGDIANACTTTAECPPHQPNEQAYACAGSPLICQRPADATNQNPITPPLYDTPFGFFTTPDQFVKPTFYGEAQWQSKKYASRTLRGDGDMKGRMRNGNGSCLGTSGTLLTLVDCQQGNPARWILTGTNQIKDETSSLCIAVSLSGDGYSNPPPPTPESVSLTACASSVASTMFVFANGQVRTANGQCLSNNGGTLQSSACLPNIVNGHASQTPPPGQKWTLLFEPLQQISTQFGSTQMPNNSAYYKTFSISNRHVCGRRSSGVWCAQNTGAGFYQLGSQCFVADYSDAWGWNQAQYGNTVRALPFGSCSSGGMAACGRGAGGAFCSNGLSTGDYSNNGGWNLNYYYDTIRYTDLYQNGQTNVCGRGYYGIVCNGVSSGGQWLPGLLWTSAFNHDTGWSDITNAATIQFADINGDGRQDVCGRSDHGIMCSAMTPDSPPNYGFINNHFWSFDTDRTEPINKRDFADSDLVLNWASNSSYYGSIRLIDVNRDGMADVCGRGALGIYCAFSTGTAFEAKQLVAPFDLTDGWGWNVAQNGGTLSFGDLDGDDRIDACARSAGGVFCTEGY